MGVKMKIYVPSLQQTRRIWLWTRFPEGTHVAAAIAATAEHVKEGPGQRRGMRAK